MNYEQLILKRRRLISPEVGLAVPVSSALTIPQSGLVHFWPMDDAHVSGTTIVDTIGGLNGTASGAGITSANGPSGAAGKARQFDGTDFIDLVTSPVADFTAASSVLFWARLNNPGASGGAGFSQRFFAFTLDANNNIGMQDDEGANGFINVTHADSLSGLFNGAESTVIVMVAGTWVCIGYSYAVGVQAKLYASGAVLPTTGPGGFSMVSGFWIGARDASPSGQMTGALSNFAMYNRELSPAEFVQFASVVP